MHFSRSLLASLASTLALALAVAAAAGGLHGSQPLVGTHRSSTILDPVTNQLTDVLSWRSDWSATAGYQPDDVVARGGSSYVATKANTGADPVSSPGSWDLLAARGADGAKGDAGAQGITGASGPAGPTGLTGPAGPQGSQGAQGAAGKLAVSNPIQFTIPAFGTAARNTTGHTVLLTIRGAVISDPGENGHIYLQIAPNVSGSPGTFTSMGYIACRNTSASSGQIACGGTLSSIVPNGGFYRLYTLTAAGYQTPDFITDGPYGNYQTID